MDTKKHFQKQTLNRNDNKIIVNGAKAVKGLFSAVGAAALIVLNKDNIKTIVKGVGSVVRTIKK